MDDLSFHFEGHTVVSRGEWQMQVPVEFNLFLDECADPFYVDQVKVFLAEKFTSEYIARHDEAYRLAMMEEDAHEI